MLERNFMANEMILIISHHLFSVISVVQFVFDKFLKKFTHLTEENTL